MSKRLVMLATALLLFGCMAWAAEKPFKGVISDTNCGTKHSTASDEAAACVAKCVSGGAKYALVSHGKVYQLDPQDKVSAELAGKTVKVTGTLKGDTITISEAYEVCRSGDCFHTCSGNKACGAGCDCK